MKKENKTCARTLLLSVILSLPCPLIVGIGLMFGRSSTQTAEFFRLTTELLGIIMAYLVYVITNREGRCDEEKKARLERMSNIFVGAIMCIGGIIMFVVCLFVSDTEKGNVIPGLLVSLAGTVANVIFWRRYAYLNKKTPNDIVAVQTRMYSAKSLVNGCVTLALLMIALFPDTLFSYHFDLVGSAVVALYVIFCGARTLFEKMHEKKES